MNVKVELDDAKAMFSELVDRAEAGETIIISRDGAVVAELRPFHPTEITEVIAQIRALRRRIANRNAGKAPWPEEGRRMRDVMHEGHRF